MCSKKGSMDITKSSPPPPKTSVSPTPSKKKQDTSSAGDQTRIPPSDKGTVPQYASAKAEQQQKVGENHPPSQSNANAKKNVPPSNDEQETKSPKQASDGKPAGMATSPVAETQKPSTPESEKGRDSQLKPKDLKLIKTSTGIMDALGVAGGKDVENARKEYQTILLYQKTLEAQMPSEEIQQWQENIDKMRKECQNVRRGASNDPLHKYLTELRKKHPEKSSKGLEEYELRKKLFESFHSKQPEKYMTRVDVQPQTEEKGQKEDKKEEEAKQDVVPPTNGPDQTDSDGQRKDNGNFMIMIPEGYEIIQGKDLEKMKYELTNQRESIEELTSRLSAIASNKLKEGNPNIADLSDKNRPTKLGEHFASLYDDEWSEALEELSKDKKEGEEEEEEDDDEEDIKSIEKLLDVVKYAYKFCGEKADEQLQKIAMGMKDAVYLAPPIVEEVVTKDSKSKPLAKSENTADTKMESKKEALAGSGTATNSTQGAAKGRAGAASQSGQTHGAGGGQTSRKPGEVIGQPGKKPGGAKPVNISGSPSSTPPGTPPIGTKEQKEAPEVVKKKTEMSETWSVALRFARTFRKETAMTAVKQIKQLFKAYYINTVKRDSAKQLPAAMEKYIDHCVELTWLMAVQDPPMEIKWVNPGERSDTNYFKFYQSKGKTVKQCVWPAVFLSANGGIVSKGYIIGMTPPSSDKQKAKSMTPPSPDKQKAK
ncbi:eukaryotic translation initiation factor 5B-like [Pecten maximus]|uniref:eukaryotic translation initiation factor 5B-like n=1 Tax=Pecten maximus TaxID=6579 RepID=UPI001458A619|nr:eukaryotic translation initiation factor 5B-like [Pecten maximus]